ncbi:MAG: hypothetical protein GXX99_03525, partial [Clostridiales bacterium]|nr:hypothetical protein [Clostridiales bacterium]
MKVVIYASMMKDTDFSVSHDVAAQLGEWGAEVWVDEQHAEHYRDLPVFTAPPADCCKDAQFVVSVGGDG